MNVEFTKNQIDIVKYDEPEMLIRGVAGSGKTLCLIANAAIKSAKNPSIYFFTFNKTLEKNIKDNFTMLNNENVHVSSFHKWAKTELKRIYPYVNTLGDNWKQKKTKLNLLEKAVKQASEYYSGRFITNEDYREFLLDEFKYMNSQYIKEENEYINLSRRGRGNEIRPSKAERQEIFEIFSFYQFEKSKSYYFEFTDYAPRLLDKYEEVVANNEMRHIYVDEAQDLDKAQLLLLSKLAQETFYVATDKGQNIYNTSYSWRDIGINIQGGRTKVLRTSFRTTEQILRLARGLHEKDDVSEEEDYTEAQLKGMKQGPKPKVIRYEKSNYKNVFIREVKEALLNNEVVGVLINSWRQGNKLADYLSETGIDAEIIRDDDGSSVTEGVKITTMFSSKGLEFDHVIIPNFSLEKNLNENDEDELNRRRRLYYVSFTRARNRLSIITPKDSPSRFFPELDEKLYVLHDS